MKYGKTKDLAEYLDLTSRQVERLLKSGVVTREKNGLINLTEASRNYWTRKATAGNSWTAEYQREKALNTRARRQILEIELKKRQNRVVDVEDVKITWAAVCSNIRATLQSFPARFASVLAGLTREEIAEIMQKEIYSTLMVLSDYDPTDDTGKIVEKLNDGEWNFDDVSKYSRGEISRDELYTDENFSDDDLSDLSDP